MFGALFLAPALATGGLPQQGLIVPVVMLTVGLSVVLHGEMVTQDPGIREAAEAPSVARRVQLTRWGDDGSRS